MTMETRSARSAWMAATAAIAFLPAWASADPTPTIAGNSHHHHHHDSGHYLTDGVEVQKVDPVLAAGSGEYSVARLWMEELLEGIRHDLSRPTVHARNLLHVSVAMWDAWAVYSANAYPYLTAEHHEAEDVQAAREEAISYAAYHVLLARFGASPGAATTVASIRALMLKLGYDPDNFVTVGDSPAAVGNRIALNVLIHGLNDNANEQGNYGNLYYLPVNDPLLPDFPGNPDITDPNRWQPLALDYFIDQGGNPIPTGYPPAVSPEWGQVTTLALSVDELDIYYRDPPAPDEDFAYWVYHDPGPPPFINGVGDDYYKWGFQLNVIWSGHHDTEDGVMWDISPATLGNSPTPDPNEYLDYYNLYDGGDWGTGYAMNPVTNQPYTPQIVPRADYTRCLVEFWSDGPASETPPGHWFTILNYVSDHPLLVKKFGGQGPALPDLEWDVKTYLTLGGTVHDTAVSIWGIKGWYDWVRPISAIRYMCDRGQCSDPLQPSYDPEGIELVPGYIEVVTAEKTMPGGYLEHLAGEEGKIAIYAWRGPVEDPENDVAGAGWMLAESWWPFFPVSFVSPPFPGYCSGHSGFSRAAALQMSAMTGSEYFPGGMGEFFFPAHEYLGVEDGPSIDITLQWAKYRDASDQTSLSRLWGGIHPPADDLVSRIIGESIAPEEYALTTMLFEGSGYVPCPNDVNLDSSVNVLDLLDLLAQWGTDPGGPPDFDGNGNVGIEDLLDLLANWGDCVS